MMRKAKERILAASNKVMPPVVKAVVYWNSQRYVVSMVLNTLSTLFRRLLLSLIVPTLASFRLPLDASIHTASTE